MSHISKIDTKIKDLGCLKKALKSMQMGYSMLWVKFTILSCKIIC